MYVTENTIISSIDVESLYSNILHREGLVAIDSFRGMDQYRYNNFILQLILMHNVFSFNGSCYLQEQGVAMGIKCTLSYTNLFLRLGALAFFK